VTVQVSHRSRDLQIAGDESKALIVSVSDTGKGIPAKELPTLFDEYRQVEGQPESDVQKGTGLSITKKFAKLLGGSIAIGRARRSRL
jgi:signal transduction histidine kinase